MADSRTYIRVHDGLFDHPKTALVGGQATFLDLAAQGYCSRNLSDGLFPATVVARLTDLPRPVQLARRLIEHDRWHEPGHCCPRCPQPPAGHYVIHDYLEHQRSAADVAAMKEQRRAAGRAGGQAKGKRAAKQTASGVLSETPSKTEASTEVRVASSEATTAGAAEPRNPRRSRLKDDFEVTPGMRSWAAQNVPGVDVDTETAQFLDHHQARGSVMADWTKAWHTWMRNARKFAPRNGSRPPATAVHDLSAQDYSDVRI